MIPSTIPASDRLPWPLPPLVAWALAWVTFWTLRQLAMPGLWAIGIACAVPLGMARHAQSNVRRCVILTGFPLSAALLGASADAPAWAWLIPLTLLLAIYPLRAWRDAPLFPTSEQALRGLGERISLPSHGRILDAGCGMGHALRALRGQWPHARLVGWEQSWPLTLAARLWCPFAAVSRADMWARSWAGYELVYLFQRPESMDRAWRKARAEMRPGAWLVSLDFEIAGIAPTFVHRTSGQRPVFAYRTPSTGLAGTAQPQHMRADKPVERAPARVVA